MELAGIKHLYEASNWPVSDVEIDKTNEYVGKTSPQGYHVMANEQWSDKFTDEQIDRGEFDKFVEYAYERYLKMFGKS